MDTGIIHRLATLCKDYYVIRTIDDLFIYAGANHAWRLEPLIDNTGERKGRFYGWVQGIQQHAPDKFDIIMNRVAVEITRNDDVPEKDREAVKASLKTLDDHEQYEPDLDPLLSTLARTLANEGLNRELAVLVNAQPELVEFDNGYGEERYNLKLSIPFKLFAQVQAEVDKCEKVILKALTPLRGSIEEIITAVTITPLLVKDNSWRDKAQVWLSGEKVNNQGRVRSDNVAPRTADGLQFRSLPEIYLYQALKSLGVSFAPLPVFVRGGDEYRRIEPDFVILKEGIVLVVEVDGDTYHRETPSEAHNRTTMLAHEGASIERINASQCDTPEKATACAKRLMGIISKLKDARR